MNNPIKLLGFTLALFLFSCEKNDSPLKYKSYMDYLSDKTIISIRIFGDDIWILSTKVCDTCYVAPYVSFRPEISQLTLVNDSGFTYEEPTLFSIPVMDHKGNLYTSSGRKIFKLNGLHDYTLFLETGNFNFNYYAFDSNDNIWLGGYNGIAFWNGLELKVYDTNNSDLPSDITHGLAIDNVGNVWLTLDFKGILKISGEKWEVIPNTEIPGLSAHSYLNSPIVDMDNKIWFHVFSPDTTSTILLCDNKEWKYQYPNKSGNGRIIIDSKSRLWIINDEYENNSFKRSTLSYLDIDTWNIFDVSMINSRILTVNSDNKRVYIGTIRGLFVIENQL
jgi:ligand-binding sensor domain-containing protein